MEEPQEMQKINLDVLDMRLPGFSQTIMRKIGAKVEDPFAAQEIIKEILTQVANEAYSIGFWKCHNDIQNTLFDNHSKVPSWATVQGEANELG